MGCAAPECGVGEALGGQVPAVVGWTQTAVHGGQRERPCSAILGDSCTVCSSDRLVRGKRST